MSFFKGGKMPYDLERRLIEETFLSVSSLIRGNDDGTGPRLQVTLDTIYDIRVMKACRYPEHRHNTFEMIFVDEGSYQCRLNGKLLKLEPGDAMLVQTGDSHMDILPMGLHYYGIGFFLHDAFAPSESQTVFNKSVAADSQALRGGLPGIREEIGRIIAERSAMDAFSYNILGGNLASLFWKLVRLIPRKHLARELLSSSKAADFKYRLLDAFQSRLDLAFDLEEISKTMRMSPSSLSHKTKEHFKLPPAKLFMKCKIDKAQNIMQSSGLSIKETSRLLGFKNQYHFSKVFKEQLGQAPSEFRRMERLCNRSPVNS